MLNGHDHVYARFAPMDPAGNADPRNGIREFVVGTGGESLDEVLPATPNLQAWADQYYGVMSLSLGHDGYSWDYQSSLLRGSTLCDMSEGTGVNDTLAGDVVTAAIGDGVARLVRNTTVIHHRHAQNDRASEDGGESPDEGAAEVVHQTRVAVRRLRSDLRAFAKAIDRQSATQLRSELGWLGDVLGAARDADMLLKRLSKHGGELPTASAAGVHELRSELARRRVEAYTSMYEALCSERHLVLIERLTEAAQAPALVDKASRRPAAAALPRVVRASWRALARRVGSLSAAPTDAELHAVRIAAKRCRYAAEACAPVLGKPARKLAHAAESLQDVLGELSDAVAAEQWLREWARQTTTSRAGAFAAGELAALERAAARRARSRWPKAWSRLEAVAPS